MKMLKKAFILQFLFLFIIPVAFAEMSITLPEKSVYNLGEKIAPIVSIKEDSNYDGFFSLRIFCDNYDLQYYAVPLSLEAGFRTQLAVPELSLSRSMIGKCKLSSNFESSDGERIDNVLSADFFVASGINITADEGLEAKPGEDIIILGKIMKQSNEALQNGEAKISFRGNEDKVNVASGKFEYKFHLSDDIEAGNTPILIVVTDKYGNYGDKILSVNVLQLPTRIENRFESNMLMPSDALKAKIILYDHKGNAINGSSINVKIFDSSEKLLAENDIESMSYFEFQTGKTQAPGAYFLLSSFENIKEQNSFVVEEVKKIGMQQEGSFVYIENIGNVEYNDEVTIILESDDKKYLINKKIELKPAEKITIDLSKEVPQGTYDIILPEEAATGEVEDVNKSAEIIETQNIIKDVPIDDNRPILKKTADGISAITGAAVSTAGYIASKPALAATILVLIILGTVARYSKDFIISKIKGKKKDDSSYLFRDFKFEEKK